MSATITLPDSKSSRARTYEKISRERERRSRDANVELGNALSKVLQIMIANPELYEALRIGPAKRVKVESFRPDESGPIIRELCSRVCKHGPAAPQTSRPLLLVVAHHLHHYMTSAQRTACAEAGLVNRAMIIRQEVSVAPARIDSLLFGYDTEETIREDSCMSSIPRAPAVGSVDQYTTAGATALIRESGFSIRSMILAPPSQVNCLRGANLRIEEYASSASRGPCTVLDPRLGSADDSEVCATCGSTRAEGCAGHPGHIDMPFPLFNPFTLKQVLKVTRCVCTWCNKILIDTFWSSADKIVEALNVISNADAGGAGGEEGQSRLASERSKLDALMKDVERNTMAIISRHREFSGRPKELRSAVMDYIESSCRSSAGDKSCPHCGRLQFQWSLSKHETYLEATLSQNARRRIEALTASTLAQDESFATAQASAVLSQIAEGEADRQRDEGMRPHAAHAAAAAAAGLLRSLDGLAGQRAVAETIDRAEDAMRMSRAQARSRTTSDILSASHLRTRRMVSNAVRAARAADGDSYLRAMRAGAFNALDERSPGLAAEMAYRCLRGIDSMTMAIMGFDAHDRTAWVSSAVNAMYGVERAALAHEEERVGADGEGGGVGGGVGGGTSRRSALALSQQPRGGACDYIRDSADGKRKLIGVICRSIFSSGADLRDLVERVTREHIASSAACVANPSYHLGMLMYKSVPLMPYCMRPKTEHGHPSITVLYNEMVRAKCYAEAVVGRLGQANASVERGQQGGIGGPSEAFPDVGGSGSGSGNGSNSDSRKSVVDYLDRVWQHAQQCLCMILSPGKYGAKFDEMEGEKGVTDELKGKETGPRAHVLGMRTNYSGTMVFTLGNHVPQGCVMFPHSVGSKMPIIETVSHHNIDSIREKIKRQNFGMEDYWRVTKVLSKTGGGGGGPVSFRAFAPGTARVRIGDRIERTMMNGDMVLIGRPPSLQSQSITAFKAIVYRGKTIVVSDKECPGKNLDFDGDAGGVIVLVVESERMEASALMDGSRIMISPAKDKGATIVAMQDGAWGIFDLSNRCIVPPSTFDSLMITGSDAYMRGGMREMGLYRTDALATARERGIAARIEALVAEAIRIAAERMAPRGQSTSPSERIRHVLANWDHEQVLRHNLFASRKRIYEEGMRSGHACEDVKRWLKMATLRHLALTQVVQRVERERICARARSAEWVCASQRRLDELWAEIDSRGASAEGMRGVSLSLISRCVSLARQLRYSSPTHVVVAHRPEPSVLLLMEGDGGEGTATTLCPQAAQALEALGVGASVHSMLQALDGVAQERHRSFVEALPRQASMRRNLEDSTKREMYTRNSSPCMTQEPPMPVMPYIRSDLSAAPWRDYAAAMSRRAVGEIGPEPPSGRDCVSYVISALSRAAVGDRREREREDVCDASAAGDPLLQIVGSTISLADLTREGDVYVRSEVDEATGLPIVSDDPGLLVWSCDSGAGAGAGRLGGEAARRAEAEVESRMRSIRDSPIGPSEMRDIEMTIRDLVYQQAEQEERALLSPAVRRARLEKRAAVEHFVASCTSAASRGEGGGVLCDPYLSRFCTVSVDEKGIASAMQWRFGDRIGGDPAARFRAERNPFVVEMMARLHRENTEELRRWEREMDAWVRFFHRVCAWVCSLPEGEARAAMGPGASAQDLDSLRRFSDSRRHFAREIVEGSIQPFMRKHAPAILAAHRQAAQRLAGEMELRMAETDRGFVRDTVSPAATERQVRHYAPFVNPRSASRPYREYYAGSAVLSNLLPRISLSRCVQRSIASDTVTIGKMMHSPAALRKLERDSLPVRKRLVAAIQDSGFRAIPPWHAAVPMPKKAAEAIRDLLVGNGAPQEVVSAWVAGRARCGAFLAEMDSQGTRRFADPAECLADYESRLSARQKLRSALERREPGVETALPGCHTEVAVLRDYGALFGEAECAQDERHLTDLMSAEQLREWRVGRLIRRRMMRGRDKEHLIIRDGVLHAGVIDGSLLDDGSNGFVFRTAIEYGEPRSASMVASFGAVGYRWCDMSTLSASLWDFLIPPQAVGGEALKFLTHPGPPGLEEARRLAFHMASREKRKILSWFDEMSALARSGDPRDVRRLRAHLARYGAGGDGGGGTRGGSDAAATATMSAEDLARHVDKLLLGLMTTLREYWAEVFVALVGGEKSLRTASAALIMMGDKTGGAGIKGNKITLAKIHNTFGNLMVGGVGMRPDSNLSRPGSHFPYGDTSSGGNGAVYSNFIVGLSYLQNVLYAHTAKEGCLQKVLSVAGAGDTSRGLHYACQDFFIGRNGSLVAPDGRVIQQRFGDTGDDPALVVTADAPHAEDWADFRDAMGISGPDLEAMLRSDRGSREADALHERRLSEQARALADRCRAVLCSESVARARSAFEALDIASVKSTEELAACLGQLPIDLEYLEAHARDWDRCLGRDLDFAMYALDEEIMNASSGKGGSSSSSSSSASGTADKSLKLRDKILRSLSTSMGMGRSDLTNMASSLAGAVALRSSILRGMTSGARGRKKGPRGDGGDGDGDGDDSDSDGAGSDLEERNPGGNGVHAFAVLKRKGFKGLPEYSAAVSRLGIKENVAGAGLGIGFGFEITEADLEAAEGAGQVDAAAVAAAAEAAAETAAASGSAESRRHASIILLYAYCKLYMAAGKLGDDGRPSPAQPDRFSSLAFASHAAIRAKGSEPSRERMDEIVCEMRRRVFESLCDPSLYSTDDPEEMRRLSARASILSDADRAKVVRVVSHAAERRACAEISERREFEEETFEDANADCALSRGTQADVKVCEARAACRAWRYLQRWGVRTGMRKADAITVPVDVKKTIKRFASVRPADDSDKATAHDVASMRVGLMRGLWSTGESMWDDQHPSEIQAGSPIRYTPNMSYLGGGGGGGGGSASPSAADDLASVLLMGMGMGMDTGAGAGAAQHPGTGTGTGTGTGMRPEEVYSRSEVERRRRALSALLTHPCHNPLFLCHLTLELNAFKCEGMSISGLRRACEYIYNRFFEVKLAYGTPMGLRIAYCLSEPVMQSMLDAFKSAGDGLDTEGRELRMRAALRVSANPDHQQLTLDIQPVVDRMNLIMEREDGDRRAAVGNGSGMLAEIESCPRKKYIFDALVSHHVSILSRVTLGDAIHSMSQAACSEKYRGSGGPCEPAMTRWGYTDRQLIDALDSSGFDYLHCGACMSHQDEDEEWVVRQLVALGYAGSIPQPADTRGLEQEEVAGFRRAWEKLYSKASFNAASVQTGTYACTDSVLRIVIDRRKMRCMHADLGEVISAIYGSRCSKGAGLQVLTDFHPGLTPARQPLFTIRIRKFYKVQCGVMSHLEHGDLSFLSSCHSQVAHMLSMRKDARREHLRSLGALAFTGMETSLSRYEGESGARSILGMDLLAQDPEFETGVPVSEEIKKQAKDQVVAELQHRRTVRERLASRGGNSHHQSQGQSQGQGQQQSQQSIASAEASRTRSILEEKEAIRERLMALHQKSASSCLALTSSNQTSDIIKPLKNSYLKGCVNFGQSRMFVEEEHEVVEVGEGESEGDNEAAAAGVKVLTLYRLRQRVAHGSIAGVDRSPYVDVRRSRTHTSIDCSRRFGIMSMVRRGEIELRELIESGGHNLSHASISLVMSFVSWPGVPSPLNGHGIAKHRCSAIERATFGSGVPIINDAAYCGKEEKLSGLLSVLYACGNSGIGTDAAVYVPAACVPA